MMKRIIGLLLVVVMMTLTLVGCGFNYTREDMTDYTEFDVDAFRAAMLNLKITDHEFTADDTVRYAIAKDKVYKALKDTVKGNNETNVNVTEIGDHDVVCYNYYVTYTEDGKTYTFYTTSTISTESTMKESAAIELQLGVTTNDDETLAGKIDAAILAYLQGKANFNEIAYDTSTTGKAAAGDTVYVSYTYSYTDSEGNPTAKTAVAYRVMTLDGTNTDKATSFDANLIGLTFGEKQTSIAPMSGEGDDATALELNFDVNGDGNKENKVQLTDVTVHWKVTGGKDTAIEVKHTTFKSDTNLKVVNPEGGVTTFNVKDKELTYHIYPTSVILVPELTAENIITELYGDKLTTTSIKLFEGEAYKAAVEAYVAAEKAFAEAEDNESKALTEYNAAKKAVEDASKDGGTPTEEQTTAETKAKEAYETAQGKTETAKTDITTKLTALLAVESGVEGKDTATLVVEQRVQQEYDTLEDTYNSYIKYTLAEEIYNLIMESVTVTELPKRAVDEAYDELIDSYESTFYTGTSSTTGNSLYYDNQGSFKTYLTTLKEVDTYDAALEAVRKEAEAAVTPAIKIYAVAEALDLELTNKEYRELEKMYSEDYIESTFGEFNFRLANQIDKILNYYLELGEDDYDEDDDIKLTEDGKLPYDQDKIKYSFE